MLSRRALLLGSAAAIVAVTARIFWQAIDRYIVSDPTQFVRSLWTGAVDHCSVTASVVTSGVVAPMRLVAATTPDFIDPRYSKVILPDPEYFCCRGSIEALSPATAYYLGVELHGRIDDSKVGRFRTAAAGAHSFRFAAASCATTGSNATVFDNITTADPDFFVHLGDMHYEDIDEDDEALFHEAYNEVFDARRQNRCWREIPMYYIWDDHDFIKKNDDRQSVSGCEAAVAAYRRRVPSPPLSTKGACDPVHYAFVRGRVRFVISDLRSARTPSKQPDDERKSMLGGAQLAWLSRQFADARAAGEAVIWASTVPWIAGCSESKDSWGGFSFERARIVEMLREAGMLDSVAILSGDMHALAFDDGTHSPGGMPVMQAAPLDQENTEKGGPYSFGPITASESQYGLIDVSDDGSDRLRFRFRGISVDRDTGRETVEIDEYLHLAAGPSAGGNRG